LGLALVKEVVEAHQGYIDVQSTPQVGTTFILSFPLVQKTSAPVNEIQVISQ
jgi:two-component system, OmpR family, phosphate regulon sensor histidine kinase PhoR